MKSLSALLAAMSALTLISISSSASPLANGFAFGTTSPGLNDGLVQNVQLGSCREKQMDWTVQQRKLCRDYHKQKSKKPAKPKSKK
jgi:hypothetical protein